MVTVLDQNENKINSLKLNLEKLEDNYHRENMEIEDKLYSLEDKKNELETYLQEVYEETSHFLRQNDSDGSTFMSLNRIIESYQMELIDEYENYKQTIVLNPFGGALADRFQRRKILLITDAICAIMCFLLSFIGDDKVMVYGLIVANAILAVSNAFSSPAYKSYIPEIVDKADIITYNANLETIVQIISVSSPVLGFLIFNNFGIRITLIVDAITFLISFLFLYAIKVEGYSFQNKKR